MVTYNMPLRPTGRGGENRGMVSLDIPVSHLTEQVDVLSHLPGWQVSLVAPAGLLAMHPQADVALQRTLPDYIEAQGRSDLTGAAAAIRLHQPISYLHTNPRDGERLFTAVAPVSDSGWSLMVSQSYDPILAQFKPVSFTHLDCYKRQILTRVRLENRPSNRSSFSNRSTSNALFPCSKAFSLFFAAYSAALIQAYFCSMHHSAVGQPTVTLGSLTPQPD